MYIYIILQFIFFYNFFLITCGKQVSQNRKNNKNYKDRNIFPPSNSNKNSKVLKKKKTIINKPKKDVLILDKQSIKGVPLKEKIVERKVTVNTSDINQSQNQINNDDMLDNVVTCNDNNNERLDIAFQNKTNKDSFSVMNNNEPYVSRRINSDKNIFPKKVDTNKNLTISKNLINKKKENNSCKNGSTNESSKDSCGAKTSEQIIEMELAKDSLNEEIKSVKRKQKTYPTLEDVLSSEKSSNKLLIESLKNHKKKKGRNEGSKSKNKKCSAETFHTKELDETIANECTVKKNFTISQNEDERKIEKTTN